MKEFVMNAYKIEKLKSNDLSHGGLVNIEIGVEMEYMVSFWYIGKIMSDQKDDFLFYNDKNCLYVEDTSVEAITGKGDGTKETNGIDLDVDGRIVEGEDKDELLKELV